MRARALVAALVWLACAASCGTVEVESADPPDPDDLVARSYSAAEAIRVADLSRKPKGALQRCFASPAPDGLNAISGPGYSVDCDRQGWRWTVPLQSERSGDEATTCAGATSQSLPLHDWGTGGPAQIGLSGAAGASGLTLKQDYSLFEHPCGANVFNWQVLMRHGDHGGGALPKPAAARLTARYRWNTFSQSASASRLVVGFQGAWNGASHLVEINLHAPGWGDAHPDPDVVLARPWPNGLQDYVLLDASAMRGALISAHKPAAGRFQQIDVRWRPILDDLVRRGLLHRPEGGWGAAATQAVFLGFEHNNRRAIAAGVSELEIYALDIGSTPGDMPANTPGDSPSCQPITAGRFKIGRAIYYSNGSAYCHYANWSDYLRSGGPSDTSRIREIARVPSCMKGGGACNVPAPACEAIPPGMFIVGQTVYYSNGSAYCHYPSWDAYRRAGGPADTSRLRAPGSIPACMADHGAC